MKAIEVLGQNDGEVTKAYYAELASRGPIGRVAVALFRSQKRSSRAKDYRRGKYRRLAYDVKQWSLDQLCRELAEHGAELGITYGWRQDPDTIFGGDPSWVLYCDLPQGQVSFHSPSRGKGPDYLTDWDRSKASAERIVAFCDSVMGGGRQEIRQPSLWEVSAP
jgi:hypothetical protein